MGQEPIHDLAFYLCLQDFEVEEVEQVTDRRWGTIKVVHVVRRQGLHRCPDCDRRHRHGLFDEFEPVRFRDCSIGDWPTFIQVRAMRIACCGGTRVEQLPFVMPGFRMTRRFFSRIAALCTRLPIQAELATLSATVLLSV